MGKFPGLGNLTDFSRFKFFVILYFIQQQSGKIKHLAIMK